MGVAGDRDETDASVAHWWHQRLTAVALIPLSLWFAFGLTGIDLGSQAAVVAWIGGPLNATLLGLLATSGVYHSWLGVRVVLEDYVPDEGQLRVSLACSQAAHAVVLAVCLFAILRVVFGPA